MPVRHLPGIPKIDARSFLVQAPHKLKVAMWPLLASRRIRPRGFRGCIPDAAIEEEEDNGPNVEQGG
jgi:hypothetical protein